MNEADITVINHGSLMGLCPATTAGEQWLAENLPGDTPCLGKTRFCEPRFIVDIFQGAQADGLVIE